MYDIDLLSQMLPVRNGKISMKQLYEFLGYDISHYSRWVRRNLLYNKSLQCNVDYIPIVIYAEGQPNPTTEYMVSLDVGKDLALKAHNEIGLQVREYFIKQEKVLAKVLQNI